MSEESKVLVAEENFFTSLTHSNVPTLDSILAPDFILIDLSGSVLDRVTLLTAIESGELKFSDIRVIERKVRVYGSAAVVTGQTEMKGTAGEIAFSVQSLYTHVYVKTYETWQLASAQGTPLAGTT